MVVYYSAYFQGKKHQTLSHCVFRIGHELSTAVGIRDDMHMSDYVFLDANFILLQSAGEARCRIAIFSWQYQVTPSTLQMLLAQ